MQFKYAHGATPLDPDEITGLIPQHITTQNQLNEWEQANILEAEKWAFTRKNKHILELEFFKKTHKKMFDQTWQWAGRFRKSNKNIGVLWEQISTQLKLLIDDTKYNMDNNTYSPDELATRFHHRLVAIHAFPNGNGRHARLMTDILLFNGGNSRFTWGQRDLIVNNHSRKKYIASLRNADNGSYDDLMCFVRS